MKHEFIFGLDLDGCCADFYAGIRPLAAEWLGVSESSLAREVTYGLPEWGFDRAPGGYPAFHHWAITQRDLFLKLPTIDGAPQALRRLSAADIRIRVITHRLYVKHFHEKAVSQTIEWLDSHGIPYWDLCFMQRKTHVGAHVYVEDTEKNIVELQATLGDAHKDRVIIYSNSTNWHVPGNRARSWLEVEALVMRMRQTMFPAIEQ